MGHKTDPKVKKPTAADRTVNMFTGTTPIDDRPIEVLESEEKAERVPFEQDADRLRDIAFRGQEWTSKAFGEPDAEGNEYRVSRKGSHYYLETLHKLKGAATVHGYSGLMVHENDLFSVTAVLVQAVRDKQKLDAERQAREKANGK